MSLFSENMGGGLKVDFESHLKLDSFSKSYIYSERGNFATSFYNKDSISMFFFEMVDFYTGGGLIHFELSQSVWSL